MSQAKKEKAIKIRHTWDHILSYNKHVPYIATPMHSRSFVSRALPGVKFNITCAMSEDEKFTVFLTKTPDTPANATIRILIHKEEKKRADVSGWTNNYVFKDIHHDFRTAMQNYDDDGAGHPFVCEIIWRGHDELKPHLDLYHHMKKFFNTSEFTDMVIVIDDQEIPVHKIVLASQSPVFLAIFQNNNQKSTKKRIIIKDIEAYVMKMAVMFLYTGEIDAQLDVDVVLSILGVADKYQIIDLKKYCKYILSPKISMENAVKILEKASLYGVSDLVEKTTSFMIDNKKKIVDLEAFKDLYRRKPELLAKFSVPNTMELPTAPTKRKYKRAKDSATF